MPLAAVACITNITAARSAIAAASFCRIDATFVPRASRFMPQERRWPGVVPCRPPIPLPCAGCDLAASPDKASPARLTGRASRIGAVRQSGTRNAGCPCVPSACRTSAVAWASSLIGRRRARRLSMPSWAVCAAGLSGCTHVRSPVEKAIRTRRGQTQPEAPLARCQDIRLHHRA